MISYLAIEDILVLHDYAIQRYGGSYGVLNKEQLESALNTPRQTMFGEELYPDLFAKAAILVYLLIKNHPFIDGNKRTALYAMLRFLEINNLTLRVNDNNELYQLTLDITTSKLDKVKIEEWLRTHAVPISQGD